MLRAEPGRVQLPADGGSCTCDRPSGRKQIVQRRTVSGMLSSVMGNPVDRINVDENEANPTCNIASVDSILVKASS